VGSTYQIFYAKQVQNNGNENLVVGFSNINETRNYRTLSVRQSTAQPVDVLIEDAIRSCDRTRKIPQGNIVLNVVVILSQKSPTLEPTLHLSYLLNHVERAVFANC